MARGVGLSSGDSCRAAVRHSMNSVESFSLQKVRSSSSDWNSGSGFFFVNFMGAPFSSIPVPATDSSYQCGAQCERDEEISSAFRNLWRRGADCCFGEFRSHRMGRRNTLKDGSAGKNLTIHLPGHLIGRLRDRAAIRNQSMTTVVKEAIARMLAEESEREAAASRLIRRLQDAPDRGIGGEITWNRDELHDR